MDDDESFKKWFDRLKSSTQVLFVIDIVTSLIDLIIIIILLTNYISI